MNPLERALASIAPQWALSRAKARRALDVLSQYEGAKTTRLRKRMRDHRAPDVITRQSTAEVRSYARHLERDHDIARGILRVLVRNVVGADGIGIEPLPRDLDGRIHTGLADQILRLLVDWSRRPDVTWLHDFAGLQRAAARVWLRDGEVFAQMLTGRVLGLQHGTRVPFSLELLEADLVPLDFEDPARRIRQGVERNAWHRPVAYWVHKSHPGDEGVVALRSSDMKRVPAQNMLHLALRDRLQQTRGVSVFCAVINRLEDLKEYEDSERIAARINASLAAVIKRGSDSEAASPEMPFNAGMVWDGAGPGDEITPVDTKRPNPNANAFVNGQLRRVSAGTDVGYSSSSRDYNGTYSAQRQELVEQFSAYKVLTREFVAGFVRPIYEQIVGTALLAGELELPADLDPATLMHADFRGPAMPWVDPEKEIRAVRLAVRTGTTSLAQAIRERGGDPWDTFEQIRDERAYLDKENVITESDPAHDKGREPVETTEQ